MKYRWFCWLGWGLSLNVWTVPAIAHEHHEGDIIIGCSVTGQLKVESDEQMLSGAEEIVLPPISPGNPGLYEGWASDAPGFDHRAADVPEDDLYTLPAGADIWLVAVSMDAAMKVRRVALGFPVVLDGAGDAYGLGGSNLHAHVIWQIDRLDEAWDSRVHRYSGTFVIEDRGASGCTVSEPFSLTFAPEPTTALLILLGCVWAQGRRDRRAEDNGREV